MKCQSCLVFVQLVDYTRNANIDCGVFVQHDTPNVPLGVTWNKLTLFGVVVMWKASPC